MVETGCQRESISTLFPIASRLLLMALWFMATACRVLRRMASCLANSCATSRERINKSSALEGPRTRRHPLRNSSALMKPSPEVSRRSKRTLASDIRMSTASKKSCMSGWSKDCLKSGQVMVPFELWSAAVKTRRALCMTYPCLSSFAISKAVSRNMPEMTFSNAIWLKATYRMKINTSTVPSRTFVISPRTSVISPQSLPPVTA
mmetsp:Transcript_26753/g.73543  ORF Transcript_26753/g.73543 Transcript_26753/m.73543 type:complete len:205 (+) Transcript_26753:270-884(+)